MPRKTLKQFAPSPARLQEIRALRLLGSWLHRPNLWHINRFSASMAFFVGLFCAMLPIPGQTLVAALLAIRISCNLPLSVGLVWVTNPLTIAPIFYLAYKLGALILGAPVKATEMQFTPAWLWDQIELIWKPLLLGSLLMGLFFGSVGYFTINVLWRWRVRANWQHRKERRESAAKLAAMRSSPDAEPPPAPDGPP